MLTIRPAFTAFIRQNTGLSVLGPECGQMPTEGREQDRDVLVAAAEGQSQPTLDKILRVVSAEPVSSENFRESQVEGIFSVDLEAGQNALGTLFVDTTPQAEGVQFYFHDARR